MLVRISCRKTACWWGIGGGRRISEGCSVHGGGVDVGVGSDEKQRKGYTREQEDGMMGRGSDIPFSFPSIKMNTDCSPNRFRKYHDRLDTHWTSRSLVATPDCSIDLKRSVSGNGSFTIMTRLALRDDSLPKTKIRTMRKGVHLRTTNPLKNALTHPIINVCGIIIAIFPFIIPIMPSIAAGSVIGLLAPFPLALLSFKKFPSLNSLIR